MKGFKKAFREQDSIVQRRRILLYRLMSRDLSTIACMHSSTLLDMSNRQQPAGSYCHVSCDSSCLGTLNSDPLRKRTDKDESLTERTEGTNMGRRRQHTTQVFAHTELLRLSNTLLRTVQLPRQTSHCKTPTARSLSVRSKISASAPFLFHVTNTPGSE